MSWSTWQTPLSRGLAAVRRFFLKVYAYYDNPKPVLWAGSYFFFAVILFFAAVSAGLGALDLKGDWKNPAEHATRVKPEGLPSIEVTPDGPAPTVRKKGFGWEMNWGIHHLAVIPVVLLCSGLVLRMIPDVASDVIASGMLVDGQYHPIPPDRAEEDWRRMRIGPFLFGAMGVLALAMSWGEWVVGSLVPIATMKSPEPHADWGWTAGRLIDPSVSPVVNAALSFVAFTAQAYIIMFFFYTLAMILAFCNWLFSYTIVADLSSQDHRMGFERFQALIYRFLWFALAFLVSFFCIRIQSLYNVSESLDETVYEFALTDIRTGFLSGAEEIFRGHFSGLLDPGRATNYSTQVVCLACVVLLMLALVLPTLILSVLAYDARANLHKCLGNQTCPPRDSREMKTDDCRVMLKGMSIWPLRYPGPIELLCFIVFSAFCFFFYKFTFVLIGLLAFRMVGVVWKAMTPPARDAPGGPPQG